MSKENKISFRVSEEDFKELKEYAQELDIALSDFMRSHTDLFLNNQLYREIHIGLLDEENNLDNFYDALEEYSEADTKWTNTESINQIEFSEKFLETVRYAQREQFQEAYDIIEELEQNGLETEAYVLDSVVSQYKTKT